MAIPEKLYPTKFDGVRFWDISVRNDPYSQSIATVHPNEHAGMTSADAENFARLVAGARPLLEAARPIADRVFAFGGEDHEYISVSAGELRALAAATAKVAGEDA